MEDEMYYHVIASIIDNPKRLWWNKTKEDLTNEILVPFVNKQVKFVNKGGRKILFNFNSISYLRIIETNTRLYKRSKSIPIEFENDQFINEHDVTEKFLNEIRGISFVPSSSILQHLFTVPINQVFVIMQYNNSVVDSAYREVIKPVIEAHGLVSYQVSEVQDGGNISEQIIQNIAKSKIIIAELTGERPNCYYEAGFAQALGKEMIFCIHENHTVHFDLATYRFIVWNTESDLRRKLTERISAILDRQNQEQ